MPQKLTRTLAEELLVWRVWRATLVNMRGTNDAEVDGVIDKIDAAIRSVSNLRAADDIDKVVR
jgi:hypothetical protein